MADLQQEHGRLVARLKRLIGRYERSGNRDYLDRMLQTTAELIVVERRLADPLAKVSAPSWEDVQARLRLMQAGAGIEVPS